MTISDLIAASRESIFHQRFIVPSTLAMTLREWFLTTINDHATFQI